MQLELKGVDSGEVGSFRESALIYYQERENSKEVYKLGALILAGGNMQASADYFQKFSSLAMPGSKMQESTRTPRKTQEERTKQLQDSFKEIESLWQTND